MAPLRHALIMAAGRGARMMPLTDSLPKAMAPYKGTTLIAQGVDRIRRHVDHIHITVGYRGAMLAEHVIHHGVATVFNTEGHGNCWWLYNTLMAQLDEPVAVLTCDNVVELDFDLLQENYETYGEPPCMMVPVEPMSGIEGDYIFHDDHVITRISREDPAPVYNSGIQIVNPRKVRETTREVENFSEIWAQLILQRRLIASHVYPKRWFSVDTVEQLKLALGDKVDQYGSQVVGREASDGQPI